MTMKLYVENQNHKCAIPDSKLKPLSGVYAHGELDCLAGFDLLNIDKKNSFDRRRNYYGEPMIAVLPDGKEIKSLLFFWHSTEVYVNDISYPWENEKLIYRKIYREQRGLLVMPSDKHAIKQAKKYFNKRSNML